MWRTIMLERIKTNEEKLDKIILVIKELENGLKKDIQNIKIRLNIK